MSLGEKSQAATVFPIWHWTTFVRWPTHNNNSFLYVVFQQIFVESTMFKASCFELNVWRVNLYSSSRKNTFPKDFARIGTRSSTSFWDQKVLGFGFFTDVRAHLSVRGPYAPHTPQWEPLLRGPLTTWCELVWDKWLQLTPPNFQQDIGVNTRAT